MATRPNTYTSHLLSHFVGTTDRGEEIDADTQYERLATILASGCLSSNAREFPGYKCNEGNAGYSLNPFAVFTRDQLYVQWCVCFCDIPEGALRIHSSKYGQFGLALEKSFLVPKGASPVFYVAIDSKGLIGMTRGAYFDARIADYVALRGLIFENQEALRGNVLTAQIEERFGNVSSLLDFMVLGLLKPFDSRLPDEARGNSYMEREWRVLGDVAFTRPDVAKVYVAPGYEARARGQFPEIADRVAIVPP